jgi:hypothetical protein
MMIGRIIVKKKNRRGNLRKTCQSCSTFNKKNLEKNQSKKAKAA